MSIEATGVTSAAVPVRKHPTKFSNSSGFIFLSIILIFFVLAISITVLLVMPSKKESGIGVCKDPSLSLKKILAPVASATFPSWSYIIESVYPWLSASCFDKVQII